MAEPVSVGEQVDQFIDSFNALQIAGAGLFVFVVFLGIAIWLIFGGES